MKATVYRLLDADGAPIYIGCSTNVAARLRQHEGKRDWWEDISAATFEHFDSHDEALVREAELIRDERPRENVVGLPGSESLLKRRARREARDQAWLEKRENTYQVHDGVSCSNCQRRRFTFPVGTLVADHQCEHCGQPFREQAAAA